MPLDSQRAHFLANRNASALAAEPWLAGLRRRLLACGGDVVVLQARDPDSQALAARGAPRGVRGAQARRTEVTGPPRDCHRNAATLFLRDPLRRRIVTGYYLHADDPVWRQHSWVEETDEPLPPPPPISVERAAALSVRELKAALTARGVPLAGLSEKSDLLGALTLALEAPAPPPPAAPAPASTLVEVTAEFAGADTAYFGVAIEGIENVVNFVLNNQPHEFSEGLVGLVAALPHDQQAIALGALSPHLMQEVAAHVAMAAAPEAPAEPEAPAAPGFPSIGYVPGSLGPPEHIAAQYAELAQWLSEPEPRHREAAEAGVASAQLAMAHRLQLRGGAERADVVPWVHLAAQRGHAWAQYEYGTFLLAPASMGACADGDRGDPEAAARWLRLAAEQGLPNAQRAYGRRFEEGEGAPRDLGEAVRWMRLAAARGFGRAIDDLRRLQQGCGACGVAPAAAAGGRLFACKGCRDVAYCSPDCQKRDWRERHKQECPALRAERDAKEAAEAAAAAGSDGVPD